MFGIATCLIEIHVPPAIKIWLAKNKEHFFPKENLNFLPILNSKFEKKKIPSHPTGSRNLQVAIKEKPYFLKNGLTWIFMATSLPSFSLPLCTCPMEAAAKGLSSNCSNLSCQSSPNSLTRTFWKAPHWQHLPINCTKCSFSMNNRFSRLPVCHPCK